MGSQGHAAHPCEMPQFPHRAVLGAGCVTIGLQVEGARGRQGTWGPHFLKAPRLSFRLSSTHRSSFPSPTKRREVCGSKPHDRGFGGCRWWLGRRGVVRSVTEGCPSPVLTRGKRVHNTSYSPLESRPHCNCHSPWEAALRQHEHRQPFFHMPSATSFSAAGFGQGGLKATARR